MTERALTTGRVQGGGRITSVGRWSARHPAWMIALWVLLLAGATLGHRALDTTYSDNFTLPGSTASQGLTLLQQHDPSAGGQTGQLVFTVNSGSLATKDAAIEGAVDNVRKLPDVLSASDPLSAATTSKNGRTAYSTVNFSTSPVALGSSYLDQVDHAVAGARSAGVHVDYGGLLGQAARPSGGDLRSEVIGIGVALVVLLVGFGSVYAAGLPLLTAIVGAMTGIGVLGVVASTATFATASPTLGVMIGLGVGIDYGLFLITRHRQQVIDGVDPIEAAARTVGTSGRSVVIAASTVVIALLGLYASGIGFIGKLGLAAAITVAVSALCAVTLVPALLGLLGRSIDRRHIRQPVAEASAEHSGWQRYAERIGAHPWRYLLAGVALLVVLAIPVLSLRLGHVDAGADPTSYTDKRAYDAISAAFGPGANGPFVVVAELDRNKTATPSQLQSLETSLHAALANTADVASVGPIQASPDGALLYATVVPKSSPQDAATDQLDTTLQDQTLPSVLSKADATGYVTGSLAGNLDFVNDTSSHLPIIIGVVVATAFLLLLATFRSPVLALVAAILNLFSIGAAYGVVVAVFQWGWGGSLLGISEKIPIESYVPMIMFAIVFGLSMDYEVFLLTRVREGWQRSADNHTAVAHGIAATARVIMCAALIIVSVFLAFLLSTNVVIKMLALGLGASILIDASIIRLLVVPAAMFLLGKANWWTPKCLSRLPDLLEPGPEPAETPSQGPDPTSRELVRP